MSLGYWMASSHSVVPSLCWPFGLSQIECCTYCVAEKTCSHLPFRHCLAGYCATENVFLLNSRFK